MYEMYLQSWIIKENYRCQSNLYYALTIPAREQDGVRELAIKDQIPMHIEHSFHATLKTIT